MTDFELDVRPLLRNGGEPFGAIIGAVTQLEEGQRLRLYVTFKPEPLFKVMAGKGFTHEATSFDNGDWVVTFTPAQGGRRAGIGRCRIPGNLAGSRPVSRLHRTRSARAMVQILGALEDTTEGTVLFALLGREPIFLFPELLARGHAWAGDFDETGDAYRLMIQVGAAS